MANEFKIKKGLIVDGDSTFSGSLESTQDITASAFLGDGSALTGITAEWDGSHNGDAEITGSLIVSGSGVELEVEGDITITDGNRLNIKSTGGTYTGYIEKGNYDATVNLGLTTTFTNARRIYINDGTNQRWEFGGSTTGASDNIIAPGSGYSESSIYAGHAGNIGFFTRGSTVNANVMQLFDRTDNNNHGVKLIYKSGGTYSDGLMLDNTGNVGIGNTSPAAKLNVKGTGTTSATTALLIENSAGTDLLEVEDGGNVGIGTSSPSYKLHVEGDVRIGQSNKFYIDNNNVGIYKDSNNLALGGYTGIQFHVQSTTVGSQAERMRIDSAGRVGIGTTSPAEKLHVVGDAKIEDDLHVEGDLYLEGDLDFRVINSSGFGQPGIELPNFIDTFWRADRRFTLSVTGGQSAAGIAGLFDGQYSNLISFAANSTHTITINVANQSGVPANGFTYPQGYIYISFYSNTNNYDSISGRVKDRNGVYYNMSGLTDIIPNDSNYKVMRLTVPGNNYVVEYELTLVTNANIVRLAAINYVSTRHTSQMELPYLAKTNDTSRLFGNVEVLTNTGGDQNRISGTGDSYFAVDTGDVGIGIAAPTAKLNIVGNGTTSSTTALLIENSAGTDLVKIRDDSFIIGNPQVNFGSGLHIERSGPSVSFKTTNNAVASGLVFQNSGGSTTARIYHTPDTGKIDFWPSNGGSKMNLTTAGLELTGSLVIDGDVTASAFVGDGSALTGITAEWDGSHNGDAEITGSLTISGSSADLTVTGNVGIGTTSPTGRNGFTGQKVFELYNASSYASLNVTGNGSTFGTLGAQSSGVDLRSSGPLRLATNGNNTRMTLDTSGNVGIGTTSPAEKLTVEGNISGSGDINIVGDVTASAFVGDGSALTNITATPAGSDTEIQFNNAGALGASNNLSYSNGVLEIGYIGGAHTKAIQLFGTDRIIGTDGSRQIRLYTDRVNIGEYAGVVDAALAVKGSGATSATTALLIQNSSGTDLFKIRDDGHSIFNAGVEVNDLKVSIVKLNYINTYNNSYTVALTNGSTGDIDFWKNVGIGKTTTPQARLHISGSGNTSSTTALLVENSTGTDLFKVEDGGNVGIGTTSTTSKLNVDGGISTSGTAGDIDSSRSFILSTLGTNRGGIYSDQILTGDVGRSLDDVVAYSANGTFGITVGTTTNKVLTVSGSSVGIGTETPDKELHVVGSAKITGGVTGSSFTGSFVGDGSGLTGIGGGTPGGSNTEVQFNDNGNFSGDSGLAYDAVGSTLIVGTAISMNAVLKETYTATSLPTSTANVIAALSYSGISRLGMFFDYVVVESGGDMRAGTVMVAANGTSITSTDNSTADIGSTAGVIWSAAINNINQTVDLTLTTPSAGSWSTRIYVRSI